MAFTDYIDLRTAVIEEVGNSVIAEVFDRLTKLAEANLNRKLRTRHQITATTLTFTEQVAPLPDDFAEIIGLYDGNGCEYVARPYQETARRYPVHTYSVTGSSIVGPSGDVTFHYYAKIPTLTASPTTSNWLLAQYPSVYLYAVTLEAEKHLRRSDEAQAVAGMLNMELDDLARDDAGKMYSRARVRVQGIVP